MSSARDARRRMIARLVVAGVFVSVGDACRDVAPESKTPRVSSSVTPSSEALTSQPSSSVPSKPSLEVASAAPSATSTVTAQTAAPSASVVRVSKVVPFPQPEHCPPRPVRHPTPVDRSPYCAERVFCSTFSPSDPLPEAHLAAPFEHCAPFSERVMGPGTPAFALSETREQRKTTPNTCCYLGLEVHPAGRPFERRARVISRDWV